MGPPPAKEGKGLSEKKTYRFGSKAACHTVIVRGAEPQYAPGTAVIIGRQRELLAEFGEIGPEFQVLDINGDPLLDPGTGRAMGFTANARGHFWDSRVAQETHGWTDEEHDRVVARVQYCCKIDPKHVWELEDVRFDPPWPKYDTTHHNTIPQIASDAGLLGETIRYEQQNKNREALVKKLEALIAKEQEEMDAEGALVAS